MVSVHPGIPERLGARPTSSSLTNLGVLAVASQESSSTKNGCQRKCTHRFALVPHQKNIGQAVDRQAYLSLISLLFSNTYDPDCPRYN